MLSTLAPEMFTPQVVNVFYQRCFSKLAPKPTAAFEGPSTLKQSSPGYYYPYPSHSAGGYPVKEELLSSSRFSVSQTPPAEPDFPQPRIRMSRVELEKAGKDRYLERKIIVNAFCNGIGFDGVQAELKRARLNSMMYLSAYEGIEARTTASWTTSSNRATSTSKTSLGRANPRASRTEPKP